MVTERILQITFFCVLLIWQNPANILNTNHLSFIYSFLLSLAFLLLIHCARHTFATLTLASGATIDNVAKMLGHANVNMTRRYAKVLDSSIMRDMEVVAENMVL